jgi:membrane protein
MAQKISRFEKYRSEAMALWEERSTGFPPPFPRIYRFAHFWVLVWKSFTRNRCPVRASALAYTSLLALIPMLAVVMSITSSFLKKEGENRIDEFIVKMVSTITPPAVLNSTNFGTVGPLLTTLTNLGPAKTAETNATNPSSASNAPLTNSNPPFVAVATNVDSPTNPNPGLTMIQPRLDQASTNHSAALGFSAYTREEESVRARKDIARFIYQFTQTTRSGTLGITGTVLLIFVAISMLTRIEETFNDIWGVVKGRTFFTRIVLYWGVISLAPLLLVVALGLASGPHFEGPKQMIKTMPFVSHLVFQILPVVVVCLTFSVVYMLIPNTKVRPQAALVGGLVGGILFHLNNVVSVLYVSRVVSNSKIYGSLGLVPVFMIGLYLAWIILLFGAQVAYAYQNRSTYLEERQVENVNQRGREFVAMRLMTRIGQRFLAGSSALSVVEIGKQLCVPTKLIQQTLHTLCSAELIVETSGPEPSYVPARPLEKINCYDILQAMRATNGQELATRDEPTREEVYGEFSRIQEAERKAATTVTMLALAMRAQAQEKDQLPGAEMDPEKLRPCSSI